MSARDKHNTSDASYRPFEEPTSEDDLDLQELDPKASSALLSGDAQKPKGPGFVQRERGDSIALRNLRSDSYRGHRQRSRRYGEPDRLRDEDNEDLHDLLGDSSMGYQRDSAVIPRMSGESDTHEHVTRLGSRRLGALLRLGSKLGIPMLGTTATGQSTSLGREQPDGIGEAHDPTATRHIEVGREQSYRYPPNSVSNAKYTPFSFLPRTLYNEFSFFFNLYFLLVALSQLIPSLRIGYLSTYVAPLAFVLTITLGKEAADDIARRRRDAESNAEAYTVLHFDDSIDDSTSIHVRRGNLGPPIAPRSNESKKHGRQRRKDRLTEIEEEEEELQGHDVRGAISADVREVSKKSKDLKVGDVLKMGRDQRVPADVVILQSYTSEASITVTSSLQQSASNVEESPLVDPISDPPIENNTATIVDSKESTSADHNNPSADAAGSGETFIRTDQLDGETDWKLRVASPLSQSLDISQLIRLRIVAGKPDKKVDDFAGALELLPPVMFGNAQNAKKSKKTIGLGQNGLNGNGAVSYPGVKSVPLTIDNTAWANTVLASACTTLAVVVYTGPQTRQALSTAPSRSKTGLLDYEINNLTKILCALTLALSIVLVALEGFENREEQKWYVAMMRFLILFSTIIPISLRVNLDMGKTVYARFIERDRGIPGAVVRTSTIPEELGRIEYLLSDKTGTLTQNGMHISIGFRESY